jgi:hypothetical protein
MNLQGSNLYRRRFFSLISVFGLAQFVIGFLSFFRIPQIISNSSIEVTAAWFFYLGLMGWYPVYISSEINISRSSTLSEIVPVKRVRSRMWNFIYLISISISFAVTYLFPLDSSRTTHLIASGVGPFALFLYVSREMSWSLGFQQGLERQNRLVAYSVLGALVSFLSILLMVQTSYWDSRDNFYRFHFLQFVTILGVGMPTLISYTSARLNKIRPKKIASRNSIIETVAIFPPALVSGFDTLAIVLLLDSGELIDYGIYSRFLILTSLVPSALQVHFANKYSSGAAQENEKVILKQLFALNLPIIIILVVFASKVVSFLYGESTELNILALVFVILIGGFYNFWILKYSEMLAKDKFRLVFGRIALFWILPLNILLLITCTLLFGFLGPFISCFVTYLLAYAICNFVVRKFK